MAETTSTPLPAVDYLKIPEDGPPWLEGCECAACHAVFLGTRSVCSRCGARDQMRSKRLGETGTLYSYAIVHRSFPGVEVPFVSAIVDLDGGGTLKGNLVDVEPDPAKIHFGMPVRVVFRDALGRRDKDGNRYLAYFFTPA
ncbi:MAG: OB-fold domain-containing protein [Pseudomonadales bacterium]|jgi:uncharacterized OB-fold protein|nr:OB-fold domain-containing protein [Pseudomonadales bacterium]